MSAITVLGIGNVLWADEGFGVRCVEALQQRWAFDERQGAPVHLVDGGTQGRFVLYQQNAHGNSRDLSRAYSR